MNIVIFLIIKKTKSLTTWNSHLLAQNLKNLLRKLNINLLSSVIMGKPIYIGSTVAIVLSILVIVFSQIVQPSNVYAARAQFVFHTSNIPIIGESARITVTDDTSGTFVIYRVFLLPGGLGNEITKFANDDFMSGDSVTVCKTNFNNNEHQCVYTNIKN